MRHFCRSVLILTVFVALCLPALVIAAEPLSCTITPGDTVKVNSTIQVKAAGGTGPYWVTISDPSIVMYTPSKLDRNGRASGIWAMTAVKAGKCTFTMKDATGATATATLTVSASGPVTAVPVVPQISATLSNTNPYVNEEITLTVSGGTAPYTISADNASVILTPLSQTTWKIKPGITGNFTLSIRDSGTRTASIGGYAKERITQLSPYFRNGKAIIYTQWPDRPLQGIIDSEKLELQIMGGKGPWSVSVNPQLSLTGPLGNVNSAPYYQLKWTGAAFTTTNVIVRDSSGQVKTLTVTSPPPLLVDFWPRTRTIKQGEAFTILVRGGAAPFFIDWDQSTPLAPKLTKMTSDGDQIKEAWSIKGLAPGSYRFYIYDETSKLTKFRAVVSLTVTP